MKVLVVDDDMDLLDVMTYALRREGYSVVGATDGRQALERWEAEDPDVIVLDANLPRLDGFEVCRRIRETATTPIIMLTSMIDEKSAVRGLRLGADDYVRKPFGLSELSTRIETVRRRPSREAQSEPSAEVRRQIQAAGFTLDIDSHEAHKDGQAVHLTQIEFRLLFILAQNEGRVIPYSRLVEYTWGYDGGDIYLLKTHISHVRKKLGLPYAGRGSIRAVPGVGYALEPL